MKDAPLLKTRRRTWLSPAGLAVLLLPAIHGRPAQTPSADTILFNGHVVTVDARFTLAQAMAITGDRFVAVGSNDQVRRLAGPRTRLVDLGGLTVVPGLADDHLHSAGGGPGVDLSQARSLEEVLAAIAARVGASKPGELVVTNSDWHEAQLKEQRLPLRRDLDRVAPHNPVVVVRGGHEYILNSAALKKWGIDETTPEPPGGRISRYPDGTLNGELVDRAKSLVTLPSPPPRSLAERLDDQAAEYRKLNAVGLTSVRHPGISGEQYRLLEELKRQGRLTMRVSALLRPEGETTAEGVLGRLASWSRRQDEGDRWLRVGGVKLAVDGGFEGGWMSEPYAEPWGRGGTFRGLNTFSADRYTAVVRALNRAGWRVATHAVGDAAIDQVFAAYEAADADRSIVGRRWSIEHGFIPRPEHFPRMKRLGLVISAQHHLYLAGPSLVKYWGPTRAAWTTPVRAYLDAGLTVAAGTDAPVVPYPPLDVFYHFVTRDTMTGGVLGPDQRISRPEALRALTAANAYLTFEENEKGSIEPGKLADLVVLSDDLLTCPADRLRTIRVLLTMVGGRVVFSDPSFERRLDASR